MVRIELISDAHGGGGSTNHAPSSDRNLVISEIGWAGTPSDPLTEWIELANLGPAKVDLTGWQLRWYEKSGSVAPRDGTWRQIDLEGTIDPILGASFARTVPSFSRVEEGAEAGTVWRIDPHWERSATSKSTGYFLLERGDDEAIADVPADQVYDGSLGLPDRGAAMFLLSPDGTVVDSANAWPSDRDGWPAGSCEQAATMERIRLDIGDQEGNWQTHPGVLMSGRDASGAPLSATVGRPNSPSLDELIRLVEMTVVADVVEDTVTVSLPDASSATAPAIRISTAPDKLAGSGGTIELPQISTCRSDSGQSLDADLHSAAIGKYYVWVSYPEGRAFVLVLAK